MHALGIFGKVMGIAGISALAVIGMVGMPTATFVMNPGRPSAGTAVRFTDGSVGATSWQWTFGDGVSSTAQSPTHEFGGVGSYPVTLKVSGPGGMAQTTQMLEVSDEGTLVVLSQAGNAFELTLTATDPRTGNTGTGLAVPQNDVFGFFTIPALVPTAPGAPLVPEVFVKMLDARPIGQDFWLFWGGLTDLEYTLTVRNTVTGAVKVEHNPVTDSPVCLGADTSGFANVATPTPTVPGATATPTPTPSAGSVHMVNVGQGGHRFVDVATGTASTTINVGDTVEWDWGGALHSSTSGDCPPCTGDGIWNSTPMTSGIFQHIFTETDRGKSFPYFCLIHLTEMKGTVVVNP